MSEKRNIFNGTSLLVGAILFFAMGNYFNYSNNDSQILLFPFEVWKTENFETVTDWGHLFFNAFIPFFFFIGIYNWLDSNRWIEDEFFNRLEKSSFATFIRDFRKFMKDRKSK